MKQIIFFSLIAKIMRQYSNYWMIIGLVIVKAYWRR